MKLNNSNESKNRLKKVQKILSEIQLKNNKKYIDNYCEVLVENKLENQSKYFGRNPNMTSVIFDSEYCTPGELVNVKIESCNQNNLFGYFKSNKVEAA